MASSGTEPTWVNLSLLHHGSPPVGRDATKKGHGMELGRTLVAVRYRERPSLRLYMRSYGRQHLVALVVACVQGRASETEPPRFWRRSWGVVRRSHRY